MDDVTKLVEVDMTFAGRAEVIIDAQPSQFSDGYSIVLTASEALRLAHALISRVSDLRTSNHAVPLFSPALQVAS